MFLKCHSNVHLELQRLSRAERPCEGDIQRAHQILYNERKAGKNPCGIKIEGIRQFS